MPDTLKQIYSGTVNVTGLTGNQTATLFTNNATTRFVIKDVDVTNTFPVVPNLTVGGVAVAALNTNLTGSEIVDVSQSVAFSFPTTLSYSSASQWFFIGSATSRSTSTFRINGLTAATSTVDQATPTAQNSYAPVVYTAPDGDVFHISTDGDVTWNLFKYAGSASGTQTTINTGNTGNYSPVAFDGINTFYWLSSTTNLRIFNADTETTTNVTLAAGIASGNTRPRLVFSNGYLIWVSSDGAVPYFIEVSTARWITLTSNGLSADNSNHYPGFHFNPTTRVVTFMYYFVTNNFYYRYTTTLPALTNPTQSISGSWSSVTLSPSGFLGRSAGTSASHIVLSSADGGIMLDSSSFPCVLSGLSGSANGWRLTGPLFSFSNAHFRPRIVENSNPTVNTTNFPSTISLRITGVEVTP